MKDDVVERIRAGRAKLHVPARLVHGLPRAARRPLDACDRTRRPLPGGRWPRVGRNHTHARRRHVVGGRELRALAALRSIDKQHLYERDDRTSIGPGNVLHVEVSLTDGRLEIFTGVGRRGARAEDIAMELAREVQAFVTARVAVGEHLADQLLLPMALGGGGSFTTTAPSKHARTNADVLWRFLDVAIAFEELGVNRHRVRVVPGAAAR